MWNYEECVDQPCVDQPCVGWDNKPIEKEEIPQEWFDDVELFETSATDIANEHGLSATDVNKILEKYNIIKRAKDGGWEYNQNNKFSHLFTAKTMEFNGVSYVRYSRKIEQVFHFIVNEILGN